MPRVDVGQVLLGEVRGAGGAAGVSNVFVKGERVVVCSAPGRLDVLGGLGAEAGGTLAQMGLPGRVGVAVQLSDDAVVRVCEGNGEVVSVPMEGRVEEGSVAGAVVGLYRAFAAKCFLRIPERVGKGVVVRVMSGVPRGAGQGSSTAMLAGMVVALCELHQVRMEVEEQALLIRQAEGGREGMPRNGLVLDGMTSLVAQRGTMLRYSAQPHRLVGPVPVPPDLRVLAMDTGVRCGDKRETLEELRLAGAMGLRIVETIYRDLGQAHTPLHGYLTNTSPLLYRQYFRTLLPKRMRGGDFLRTYGELASANVDAGGIYRVRTAVDHLIAENEHAEQFLQAMEELAEMRAGSAGEEMEAGQRTLQRAGRLALASHHSYRLRLEMSCVEADWLVDRLMEFGPERGVYGARITATGGGGTVMALVDRGASAIDAVLAAMKGYREKFGVNLEVSEAGAAGAMEVK